MTSVLIFFLFPFRYANPVTLQWETLRVQCRHAWGLHSFWCKNDHDIQRYSMRILRFPKFGSEFITKSEGNGTDGCRFCIKSFNVRFQEVQNENGRHWPRIKVQKGEGRRWNSALEQTGESLISYGLIVLNVSCGFEIFQQLYYYWTNKAWWVLETLRISMLIPTSGNLKVARRIHTFRVKVACVIWTFKQRFLKDETEGCISMIMKG